MKIALTSTGETLESQIDPRFGRCAYFIIVDTDTMDFEVAPNQFAMAAQGAGIQASQFIIGKGVKKVVSGEFGPNSAETLSSAGILNPDMSEKIKRESKEKGGIFLGEIPFDPVVVESLKTGKPVVTYKEKSGVKDILYNMWHKIEETLKKEI